MSYLEFIEETLTAETIEELNTTKEIYMRSNMGTKEGLKLWQDRKEALQRALGT
jgi:hypothetical protein